MSESPTAEFAVLLSAEQIQKRISELGRQISDRYRGRKLHVICVLENSFIFAADLLRHIAVPTVVQFVKPTISETDEIIEIFFTPEVEVAGADVLLLEALVGSGATTEFLVRNLYGRGAKSVKVAALLDKRAERRVPVQLDYFGFQMDESYVVGYGLEDPYRNLPFLGTRPAGAAAGE